MKWLRTLVIFDKGGIVHSSNWETIHKSYIRSINRIDFPEGAGTLTLRRKTQQPNKQWSRNGVGYLKRRFIEGMVNDEHWESEVDLDLGNGYLPSEVHLYPDMTPHREPIASNFGDFDFVTAVSPGVHVAIEWETGNISSSHRSMNKLAIALAMGKIQAGVLIVPSRNLYEHLTDRIGNINELSGYLSMWKSLQAGVECGLLAISVVEHDHLTDNPDFPYLPVGNDGRSHNGDT